MSREWEEYYAEEESRNLSRFYEDFFVLAEKLLPAIRAVHAVWNTRVPTGELNRWFEDALSRHPPPLVDGRRCTRGPPCNHHCDLYRRSASRRRDDHSSSGRER